MVRVKEKIWYRDMNARPLINNNKSYQVFILKVSVKWLRERVREKYKNDYFAVSTVFDAMVGWEDEPLLLCLILFLVGKYVKDRILPHLFRIQVSKIIVHKRFNCFVNVINYTSQLVVFISVNLNTSKINFIHVKFLSSIADFSPDVERWHPSE